MHRHLPPAVSGRLRPALRLRLESDPGGGNLRGHTGGIERFDIPSDVHPNSICGTLDAIEAKFGISVIYASTVRELSTERAASWLSKHFTYWWLEKHGYGRVLVDSDGL